MGRVGACVLVLLCVCLGGCLSGDQVNPSSVLGRFRMGGTTLGPDGVLLDLVLLERRLGDPFLNDELWLSTDLQVAGMEKKELLDNNGFRVGQVVGLNPAKLQDLLDCERYCVTKRRHILPAGTPTTVPLGPVLPQCSYFMKTEDGTFDVVLDDGQCTLAIVPSLTNDGRTKLKFTPQVLHGAQLPDFHVAADRSKFEYQCKRPCKTYDALSWEVTLAPNQYLVIGTSFDPELLEEDTQSLGNQCFILDHSQLAASRQNSNLIMQRLLVIRTTRGAEIHPPRAQTGVGSAVIGGAANPLVTPAAECLHNGGW